MNQQMVLKQLESSMPQLLETMLKDPETQAVFRRWLVKEMHNGLLLELLTNLEPVFPMVVLPGGKKPRRMNIDADVGYDGFLRTISSNKKNDMDPGNPYLRRLLFDFNSVVDSSVEQYATTRHGRPAYILLPGEQALGTLGVALAMPPTIFYWITPRSGLATRMGISIANAPGTVDFGYRGEACVLIENKGKKPFYLKKNMRIAQCIFSLSFKPKFRIVDSIEELPCTKRGALGIGSTGI